MASNVFELDPNTDVFKLVSGKNWRWRYNTKTGAWDIVVKNSDPGFLSRGLFTAYQWDKDNKNWTHMIFLEGELYDEEEDYEHYYDDDLSDWDNNSTTNWVTDAEKSTIGSLWTRMSGKWVPASSLSNTETYIITHGLYNHLQDEEWISEMADYLIARGKQVIAVSWDSSGDIDAEGIRAGSQNTAALLRQLCFYFNVDLTNFVTKNLNLIGHSYGAHYSAYLARELGSKPVSLVGLDSAEENFQKFDHEIILGPNSAQTVYFYKSSVDLGGGDAGDKPLGKFNFYVVGENGQITMNVIFNGWEGGMFDNHSYAHVFYREAIKDSGANGEAGYGIENTKYYNDLSTVAGILSQSNNYNDYYIGVVGANNRIECISKAYYDLKQGSSTPAWTVQDYYASLLNLRTDKQSGFPLFLTSSGMMNHKIISDNIEAVSYLVDYIAPDSVTVDSMTSSGSLPISMNIGEDYNISFSVYNYADNHAFSHDVIKNAQENQHSSCRVWLSTSNEGLDYSKSVLINSKGYLWGLIGNTDSSLQALPEDKSDVSFDIEVTKEHIGTLGNPNNSEYYLYVEVGINEKTGNYIAGELANQDNVTAAIPVEVKNEGTATTFVVDISGSMSGEINSVKAALKNYINSGYTTGKMMKLITFWDDPGTQKLVKATSDPKEMLDAINSLRVTGGISPGEISLHALEDAVNATSRDGQIILITDEVPHTGGNPKSLAYLTSKANKKGIKIYTSFTGSFSSLSSSVYSANSSTTYALRAATVGDEDSGMDSISSESATADDTYSTATVVTANHNVTGTVHYSQDCYDWYKITLSKNYTYSFNLKSETYNAFMTLYNSDGVTEVGTIESGEGTTLYPNANVTYYMRVRAHDYQDTAYTLAIKQTGVPAANTMEAYSILATETGGSFQALPKVNSSNSAVYESAIYNFLVSQDAPVVLTCGPNELYRGTTATLTVTGSGTNWRAGQTTVSFSSEDIKVTNVEVVSATSLQVTVQVEGDCTLDSYDITVQSGTETAEGRDVVTVGSQPSSQKIVSVSSTSFECGKEFVATIHGYNTSWSQESTQLSLGPGVSITGYEVVSATEIRVAGTVDENAALGYRTVQVKTSGSTLSLSHALFVTSATPESPVITSVSPNTVTVGKASEVIITGKNLDFTTSSVSVDMGYGVEVQEITKVDATTLKVKVFATLESAEGFRDVLVSVDGQPVAAINGLDVLPDTVAPEVTLETPVVEKVSNGRIKVTLSWSSTEESTYVVNIDGTEYAVEGNSYSLELADGSHTYSVQASDYSGNKGTATGNFAMDATAPNPVELVHATTTKDGVSVSWQAGTEAVVYTLQYAMTSDFADAKEMTGLTETSCLIEDVAKEGILYVRVSAADEAGNVSDWSQVTQSNLDIIPPAVVSSVLAVTRENGVSVTWQTVEDAVSYTLQYATKSDFSDATEVSGVTAGSYLIENVADEGLLYIRVSASDAAGNESVWSSVAQTNLDIVAPAVVQGVQAITGDKLVAVSWQTVEDAASYSIQYATKADFSDAKTISGITGTSYALQPVPEMGTLYVRVAATDAAGNTSAWSSVAESALDITGPGKVDGLTVKAHGISADLSWNAASDVSGISGYFVEYADNRDFVGAQSMKIDALSATFYTLEAQTQYYWRVAAVDGAGNVGDWTVGSSFQTTEAPLEDNTPADSTNIDMSSPADGSSKNMKPIEGWVGFDDPADYYCFTAKSEGAYAISLDGAALGTQVYLSVGVADDEGNFVPTRKLLVAPGSAATALGGIALEQGEKCYIRVESYDKGLGRYNGEYSLSVNAEVADAARVTDNNSTDKATALQPGDSADAALSGWVGTGDAVDYYCFELTKPAELSLVLGELDAAVKVKLLREERDGSVSQVMSRSVKASRGLDHTLSLTSGTYFVEVASYDNGAGRYNTTYALELEKAEENGETKRFTIANA